VTPRQWVAARRSIGAHKRPDAMRTSLLGSGGNATAEVAPPLLQHACHVHLWKQGRKSRVFLIDSYREISLHVHLQWEKTIDEKTIALKVAQDPEEECSLLTQRSAAFTR